MSSLTRLFTIVFLFSTYSCDNKYKRVVVAVLILEKYLFGHNLI